MRHTERSKCPLTGRPCTPRALCGEPDPRARLATSNSLVLILRPHKALVLQVVWRVSVPCRQQSQAKPNLSFIDCFPDRASRYEMGCRHAGKTTHIPSPQSSRVLPQPPQEVRICPHGLRNDWTNGVQQSIIPTQ